MEHQEHLNRINISVWEGEEYVLPWLVRYFTDGSTVGYEGLKITGSK